MITGFLESVGVSPGTWLMLFVIAWYLMRGAQAGRKATSVLGRAVTYTVLVLVSFGAAAGLGYADLNITNFLDDVYAVGTWILEVGVTKAQSLLGGVLG